METVILKHGSHRDLLINDVRVQQSFVEIMLSEQYTHVVNKESEKVKESEKGGGMAALCVSECAEPMMWLCAEYLYRSKNTKGYPYGTCSTVLYSTVRVRYRTKQNRTT